MAVEIRPLLALGHPRQKENLEVQGSLREPNGHSQSQGMGIPRDRLEVLGSGALWALD
jgi:hypothetical protein